MAALLISNGFNANTRHLRQLSNCQLCHRNLPPLTLERKPYSFTFRSRRELLITETELRLIAAAANIGEIKTPRNG